MAIFTWFYPVLQGLFLGLVAAVLHETGHLLAAFTVSVKIKSIEFRWKGLAIVREAGTPGRNLIVSLAGPCMNLLLVAFWHLDPKFGLANLCFGFVNLLPIEGSDGLRVMQCWDQLRAERKNTRATLPIDK